MSADIRDKLKGFSFLNRGKVKAAELDEGDISKYKEIPLAHIISANHIKSYFSYPAVYDCLRDHDDGLKRLIVVDSMLSHLKDRIPQDQFETVKSSLEKMLKSRTSLEQILNHSASVFTDSIKNPQKYREALESDLYKRIHDDFEKNIKPGLIKQKKAEFTQNALAEAQRAALEAYNDDLKKADFDDALKAMREKLKNRTQKEFDKEAYKKEVLNRLKSNVDRQARNEHEKEWTPEKKWSYIADVKTNLDEEMKSSLSERAKDEFRKEVKKELNTVKYFPFRSIVKWVAGVSAAGIIAIGGANLFVMKSFHEKTMVKRPEIVALQDKNLEYILGLEPGEKVTAAVLKVNPEFALPSYKELSYKEAPSDDIAEKHFRSQMDILPTVDLPIEVQKSQLKKKERILEEIVKLSPKSRQGFHAQLELARIYSYPIDFSATVKEQKEKAAKLLDRLISSEPNSILLTTQVLSDIVNIRFRLEKESPASVYGWVQSSAKRLSGTQAGYEMDYISASLGSKNGTLLSAHPYDDRRGNLDPGLIEGVDAAPDKLTVERFLRSAGGSIRKSARGYSFASKYALKYNKPDEAINMAVRSLISDAKLNPEAYTVGDILAGLGKTQGGNDIINKEAWTPQTMFSLAIGYKGIRDYDRANKVLDKAVRIYKGTEHEAVAKNLRAGEFSDERAFLKDLLEAMKIE